MQFATITIYGIKQCDTMKKAQNWLNNHNIPFKFHDYRKEGIDEVFLNEQLTALGWETLLNKKGTTWRQLPEETKNSIIDNQTALPVLLANPAMIKRPLLIATRSEPSAADKTQIVLGFSDESYTAFFS